MKILVLSLHVRLVSVLHTAFAVAAGFVCNHLIIRQWLDHRGVGVISVPTINIISFSSLLASLATDTMNMFRFLVILCYIINITSVSAESPYRYFHWHVTYGDIFPLGVNYKQRVRTWQWRNQELTKSGLK